MVAFTYSMPLGIPGSVSRVEHAVVESMPYDTTATFSGYGLPAKLSSGKVVPMGAGSVATDCIGILVRPMPGHAVSASDPLGTYTPPTSGMGDVLRRGYITVKNNAGTPAKGGQVYVRVANASAGKPIGGFEAASDSTNTVAPANLVFEGSADASGNVEISFKM